MTSSRRTYIRTPIVHTYITRSVVYPHHSCSRTQPAASVLVVRHGQARKRSPAKRVVRTLNEGFNAVHFLPVVFNPCLQLGRLD